MLPNPAPPPPVIAKAPAPMRLPERAAEPARVPVRGAVIFTGFGLGVAGAVVGTAGFLTGNAAGDEAKEMYRALAGGHAKCTREEPGPCKDAEDKSDMARVLTAVGVAGFAASAVGGALIVYEFSRSDSEGRKVTAGLSVEPTPGGGALKITGGF